MGKQNDKLFKNIELYEQKKKAGAGPEVIRLSIGLEHSRDLINDLKSALD